MSSYLNQVGIGLRHIHYQQVLEEKPKIDWLEVHSENFFMDGGPHLDILYKIRQHYPISLHGIGLSLGSGEGIDTNHLRLLKNLIDKIDPFLVSEHLSWSKVGNLFLHDLLPIPYNTESLSIFCDNLDKAQEFLGRQILVENPSSYFQYTGSEIQEHEFLVTLVQKTGAKILLDINNIFVSSSNHNWDPIRYIKSIPTNLIGEFHLAGHSVKILPNEEKLLIDTHDNIVCKEVWDLYRLALERFGNYPTLLEWDADIPELQVLLSEAEKIRNMMHTR